MDNHVLRRLQLTQLEILKVFDQFCRQNDLKYSLYAGSLLGAVRHKAFIPWDDDLDVCMSRNEYESFIKLWKRPLPQDTFCRTKKILPASVSLFQKFGRIIPRFSKKNVRVKSIIPEFFWMFFPLTAYQTGS